MDLEIQGDARTGDARDQWEVVASVLFYGGLIELGGSDFAELAETNHAEEINTLLKSLLPEKRDAEATDAEIQAELEPKMQDALIEFIKKHPEFDE